MSVSSHREFLNVVGSEKVRATNANCEVVPIVIHDKAEPVVEVTYSKYSDMQEMSWLLWLLLRGG